MQKKVVKFSTYLCLKNFGRIDSDFDGLEDWEELELGTDPYKADTDGDGVRDGVQFKTQKSALELIFLKDLFVPHEGNGFKPFALHPGRILFYAGSALAIKMALVAFIVMMPIEAWLAPDVLQDQGRQLIGFTNELRQDMSLKPLAESNTLSRAADAKVQDMLAADYFAHISHEGKGAADWLKKVGYDYAVAGENLAMGFAEPSEIFSAWQNSPTHYANLIDPDYTEIGISVANGKFDGSDTTMAAQYFAEPKKPSLEPEYFSAATSKPTLENTDVKVQVISRSVPDKKLVRVEAVLDAGISRAEVRVGSDVIPLEQAKDGNKWTGSAIIKDNPAENKAIVPATILATSPNGDQSAADLNANVQTVRPSIISEYNYLKTNPYAAKLWSFASGYYLAMLVITTIAFSLNILVQIKKQHPHLIVSSLSLILLLSILVIV